MLQFELELSKLRMIPLEASVQHKHNKLLPTFDIMLLLSNALYIIRLIILGKIIKKNKLPG